jgi:EmrB/QacA subfamily drug resistance transporter
VPARPQRVTLAILFAGVLMAALDIAIVGPALSAIGADFGAGNRALQWVFSIYVLFYLVGTPLLAKLSDRRGRRALFAGSLALFAAGSLWVAVAPTFGALLVGRAIQGFGAGGIFPVASAVIADTVPLAQRGRMLGLIGAVFGVAFLVGPLLGGVLLEWSWRWLFVINVPIGAVLIALGLRHLPQTKAPRPAAFDFLGAALLSLALGALDFGLSQLDTGRLPGSLIAWPIWPCLVAVVVALPLFWRAEKRAADPVLHPDMFGSRQLKLAGAIALAAGLVEASMVFLPKLAVAALAVDAAASSVMMFALVLTLTVGAPLAGAALDRVGARIVVQLGLSLTIAGLALFAWLPLDTVTFYASGALVGFGLSGLLGAPLRYITLEAAGGDRRAAGQGLLTVFLSVGQLVGAALIGGVVASNASELAGYRHALLAVAAGCVVALMLSAALRGRVSVQDA